MAWNPHGNASPYAAHSPVGTGQSPYASAYQSGVYGTGGTPGGSKKGTPQNSGIYGGGGAGAGVSPGGMGLSGGLAAPSYSGIYGARYTSKLTPQEKEVIDVAFEAFKDESGYITTERLKQAFDSIDALGSIEDIQALVDDIDIDGDGKIDEEEFRHIMTKKFLGEDDDASFVHAFEMLDVNRDGLIPITEFRHVLMREGNQPLSEQEADELLMFADVEGDGLIEYKSFLRWLLNPDAQQ